MGAGGGTFISFPAALASGIPPVSATATNNVAMWLGGLASTGPLRAHMDVPRGVLVRMLLASVAGSVVGATLLLHTSNEALRGLIPLLLLAATLIFAGGPALARAPNLARSPNFARGPALARGPGQSRENLSVDSPLGLALQFAIAVYGGFFGAAIGILMLALFEILGMRDIRRANAFKVLLSAVINGVAVVPFVIARAIAWEAAAVMSAGAIAGGVLGAGLVTRLPAIVVRRFVLVVAWSMTAYFFWTTYLVHA